MCSSETIFLVLPTYREQVIQQAEQLLITAGLHVEHTFNLQNAMARDNKSITLEAPGNFCQMIVFLVYSESSKPVTLVIHGQYKKTTFGLVRAIHHPTDLQLESFIIETLSQLKNILLPVDDSSTPALVE
ncbi:MAG: hypothetical protein MUO64_10050 [Anaerolineales bacterium]|jgi:hypothetical protein|nr:hypothetical protein [Anaerolineales bacterium]